MKVAESPRDLLAESAAAEVFALVRTALPLAVSEDAPAFVQLGTATLNVVVERTGEVHLHAHVLGLSVGDLAPGVNARLGAEVFTLCRHDGVSTCVKGRLSRAAYDELRNRIHPSARSGSAPWREAFVCGVGGALVGVSFLGFLAALDPVLQAIARWWVGR